MAHCPPPLPTQLTIQQFSNFTGNRKNSYKNVLIIFMLVTYKSLLSSARVSFQPQTIIIIISLDYKNMQNNYLKKKNKKKNAVVPF